jgi:hypothetical protein
MVYRWLALAVLVLHFGYLAYLVAGGYLAWRWPRTFAPHLAATAWGALIIVTEVTCPMTWLQNTLRTRGGQPELDLSFIDTYVRGVAFPTDHEVAARIVVAVVIAVSWLGLAVRSAHPSPRVAAPEGQHV